MILVIVGPTGVGKTKLSIELAKKYDAEIINADSMQVYKELDIGTAKITEEEKEHISHHLLDICDINDIYTVYDYQKDCRKKIEEIKKRNKNVILVGGTGLYIKAALYDYRFQEESNINNYSNLSNEEIFNKIKEYEPECSIHIHNRRRLVRLLNQYENNTITEKNGNHPLYDFYMIGLTTDRNLLYQKIDQRVDNMLKQGLLQEVERLYQQNIVTKAIQTGIGYKELYSYFNGECSLDEAIDTIKKNSRHYAKRQYTFFKNQFPSIHWYQTDYDHFENTVKSITEDIEKYKKGN